METPTFCTFLAILIYSRQLIYGQNDCFKPGLCVGNTIEVRQISDKSECLKICQNEFSGACKWASFKESEKACVLSKSCRTLLNDGLFEIKYKHASAKCIGKLKS